MTIILSEVERFPVMIQDQIALAQLRRFFNGCSITSVGDTELICENEQEWSLRCSQNHLFLSDGTVIVLAGVHEVFFDRRGKQIWMIYKRNQNWKEALIAYE